MGCQPITGGGLLYVWIFRSNIGYEAADEDSMAGQFVRQSRRWFGSLWTTVAQELRQ